MTELGITTHARERFLQRMGRHSADKEMQEAVRRLIYRRPDDWHKPPKGHWRLPIDGGSIIVAPDRYGLKRLVTITVLNGHMAA